MEGKMKCTCKHSFMPNKSVNKNIKKMIAVKDKIWFLLKLFAFNFIVIDFFRSYSEGLSQ